MWGGFSETLKSTKKGAGFLALFGVLSALAFNVPSLFAVPWASFGALFLCVCHKNTKECAKSLLFFFFPFYVTAYFWFVNLYPLDFAGLSPLLSILVIITALTIIPAIHTFLSTSIITLCMSLTKPKGINAAFVFSFSYVMCEYVQSLGALAFPWARLFVTQIEFLPALQSANLFGSYFITFIIIFVSSLVSMALTLDLPKKKRIIYALCAFLIFFSNLIYGAVRINSIQYDKTITAVCLQGNISSEQKWSGGVISTSLSRYDKLIDNLPNTTHNTSPLLIVTPETAFPITLHENGRINSQNAKKLDSYAKKWTRTTDAYIIIGAFEDLQNSSYNSLYLYKKDCPPVSFYKKQKLVPFGEYLPYRKAFEILLPQLTHLNMLDSDLSAGAENQGLSDISGTKAAGLICFDSIFPKVCQTQVKKGARLIILSTNDSWYKTSSALRQHLAHAQMRSIENGVSLIRSANTGISANILPNGRVADSLGAQKYGSVISTLPITSKVTPYTLYGDKLLLAGAMYILFSAIFNLQKKIRNRSAV